MNKSRMFFWASGCAALFACGGASAVGPGSNTRGPGEASGPGCAEIEDSWQPCRDQYDTCIKTGSDSSCHVSFEKCAEGICLDAGR
jgi:hypothetical protein